MKQIPKSEEQVPEPVAAPKPAEVARSLKLRIEELEPRLAPQSTTTILD